MIVICSKPYFVFSQDGYARISLNEYSMDTFGLSEASEEIEFHSRVAHLTNLSVQKKHPEYQARKEEIAMTMEMLRDYFVGQG